jgi:hypothetical protein
MARGKREMWPHVVDARRLAPVCHRVGDGWETRLEPFTPTEDMRPVCTKCRERIDHGESRVADADRTGFFRHLAGLCSVPLAATSTPSPVADERCRCPNCVGGWGHPPFPNTVVDVTKFATPAPPVDEELERERARLAGKRVRYTDGDFHTGHAGGVAVVRDVRRRPGNDRIIDALYLTSPGFDRASGLEPIPDEKPRETTFGELAVYEWFIAPSGNLFQKTTREIVFYHHGAYNEEWIGGPDIKVTRCDPPPR